MNSLKSKSNLSYGVNDNPTIATKILLGLQHIFASFGGIIVVPLVISSALGFDATMSTAVISASILIGMIIGYLVCIPLGMVDFSEISNSKFIAIPKILEYGVTFDLKEVIAFLPAYFVTTIKTVGCLKAIGEVSDIDMDDKRVGSGVLADGIGSIIGGVVGSFPNTFFRNINWNNSCTITEFNISRR